MRNFTPSTFDAKTIESIICISKGMTYKDTAVFQQCSMERVTYRLNRVFNLLGIRSNVQLVHWALHHNLLPNNFKDLPAL